MRLSSGSLLMGRAAIAQQAPNQPGSTNSSPSTPDDNWKREMAELGFRETDYELYNKNLMSRRGNGFIDDFNRYGGPDLVIINEAHEGIRNYKNLRR